MRQKTPGLSAAVSLFFFAVSLWGGFEEGEKIFSQKCSSCHAGYIPVERIKENFFSEKNRLLRLKAPTINMLTYAILRGPKKVGDPEDPEMRQVEIEEYLRSYLEHPDRSESICDPTVMNYYEMKRPIRGLSDGDLKNLAVFFMEFDRRRLPSQGEMKRHLKGDLDLQKLLAEAKRSGKILIIEAGSPSCHYCKKMDREVLNDPEIRSMIQKDFIFAEVDVGSTRLPRKLAKAYRQITPSFFFLSPEGELLNSYPGSWTKADFASILRENRPRGIRK